MSKKKTTINNLRNLVNKTTKKVEKIKGGASKTAGNAAKSQRVKRKPKAKDSSVKLSRNRSALRKTNRHHQRHTKARKKADYLATLPKSPLKRLAYRFHPKPFFNFWFSKRGGIMALKLLGISIAVLGVFIITLFAYFRKDLPDPTTLRFDQSTRFYDRTGEVLLWSVFGDENRTLLEFGQISDYAKWAAIAIEDKDFYQHRGFSISGISRAAVSRIFGDGSGGGGSTITQQFVKNSLVGSDYTMARKIKELILAIEIERLYTKDEILTFYLNEIPYGVTEYGIESAAQGFFNKPASELTIDEAAMLAVLPNAPSFFSPYGPNTDQLIERRDLIIGLMQEQGFISKQRAQEAKDTDTLAKVIPLAERTKYRNIIAPHFILEAQKQLTERYGDKLVIRGGLTVITTLDVRLQEIAEEAVANNISRLGGIGADNVAFSASDPSNGQVVAMVGSRDFEHPEFGSFNVATSLRQPGSSFKPFVYAEMFKSDRWGPGSVIFDTPTTFVDYRPRNVDGGFRGAMTIRSALAESRNIPAVKALHIAGIQNSIDQTRRQGISTLSSPDKYGLSLVLGSAEVKLVEQVNAYAVFANGGKYHEKTYILKVTNSSGEVLEEWTETKGKQVLDPQIAYSITSILADVNARARLFGAGSPYANVNGLTMALKTGTTDLERDGWMIAYTTRLVAGAWTGNNDNRPMFGNSFTMVGSVITEFMRQAHVGLENEQFTRPAGIKTVWLNSETGRLAEGDGDRHSDIFPSWFRAIGRADSEEIIIDRISGNLATECTPERARKISTESGVLPEIPETDLMFPFWARSAPYGAVGSSREVSDVHSCSDVLPTVSVTATDNGGGHFTFSAVVDEGTHPLQTLNFKVNRQIVSSVEISSSGTYAHNHQFSSTGEFTVIAEVIDSVLYDNQNSTTVTVTSVGGSITINSPGDGATIDAGSTTVYWDSFSSGSHSLCFSKNGGTFTCQADSGNDNEESFSADPESSYTIKIMLDGTSIESTPVNFTTN